MRVPSIFIVRAVVDERSLVLMHICCLVVGNWSLVVGNWSLVMNCSFDMSFGSNFMMDGLGSFVVDGLSSLMVDGLGSLVVGRGFFLCERLEVVNGDRLLDYVMDDLMDRLIVVDDLVVLGEGTGVSIVVVHLEDKAAVFNIDLA